LSRPGTVVSAPVVSSEASPLTAEVVVELAGDVAAGWGQAGGLSLDSPSIFIADVG
jgi:hypothetical protein